MTTEQHDQQGARQSRRSYFKAIGARAIGRAAVATEEHPIPDVMRGHGHYSAMLLSDRFGRMFPQLPPFATASPAIGKRSSSSSNQCCSGQVAQDRDVSSVSRVGTRTRIGTQDGATVGWWSVAA